MTNDLERVIHFLRTGSSFLIVTHENPDGDAIGASLALTLALQSLSKKAVAYDVHPLPKYLRFLPGAANLTQEADPAAFDTICILDCGAPARTGPLKESLLAQPRVVNLDHHLTNEGYGSANLVEPKASSTCEILSGVLRELGVTLTPAIATNLYLGIYTDTMMFQNSASNPNAYRICGELTAAGADFMAVARRVYIDTSAERLLILGRALNSLQVHDDGRIAGLVCRRQDMLELGITPDDMETFVEYPRSIVGTQVAYLLREERDSERVKGSFRANIDVDVAKVAAKLGGGGHKKAAGFRVEGRLDEVRARVIELLREALETK